MHKNTLYNPTQNKGSPPMRKSLRKFWILVAVVIVGVIFFANNDYAQVVLARTRIWLDEHLVPDDVRDDATNRRIQREVAKLDRDKVDCKREQALLQQRDHQITALEKTLSSRKQDLTKVEALLAKTAPGSTATVNGKIFTYAQIKSDWIDLKKLVAELKESLQVKKLQREKLALRVEKKRAEINLKIRLIRKLIERQEKIKRARALEDLLEIQELQDETAEKMGITLQTEVVSPMKGLPVVDALRHPLH